MTLRYDGERKNINMKLITLAGKKRVQKYYRWYNIIKCQRNKKIRNELELLHQGESEKSAKNIFIPVVVLMAKNPSGLPEISLYEIFCSASTSSSVASS